MSQYIKAGGEPQKKKRKENLQPSVYCVLFLKILRAFRLSINNEKVSKIILKIVQNLRMLLVRSFYSIGECIKSGPFVNLSKVFIHFLKFLISSFLPLFVL